MEKKRPLVILTGPTAVGKTELSIQLAKAISGEIISADSIQVYRYMDIGSAKATKEEMQGVKHYLIDELDPKEAFNIYVFQQKAKQYLEQIYADGKIPIIAGGTGFYIQALLYDICFEEEDSDTEYRSSLEHLAKEQGAEVLHKMLRRVDAASAETIHVNNVKRVIRALEFYQKTGEPISKHNEEQKKRQSPYDFRYFVLNTNRERLYERIEKRVDLMLEAGLVQEVQKLLDMGYSRNLVSMQGLGYKEIAAYLYDECNLEEAVSIIKRDTRHFAKRQITWFKHEKEVQWINYEDFEMSKEKILEYLVAQCKGLLATV